MGTYRVFAHIYKYVYIIDKTRFCIVLWKSYRYA